MSSFARSASGSSDSDHSGLSSMAQARACSRLAGVSQRRGCAVSCARAAGTRSQSRHRISSTRFIKNPVGTMNKGTNTSPDDNGKRKVIAVKKRQKRTGKQFSISAKAMNHREQGEHREKSKSLSQRH